MSEIKRVTLTTISDVVKKSPFGGALDQNTAADSFGGAFGGLGGGGAGSGSGSGKNAAGSKPRKTVRLALELFEPTAQSFPEFNFSKLMHEEQKRLRKAEKKSLSNGFLSDADNDDDVARIARELEKKYGAGTAYSSSGKSARSSQLDVFDRGAGYDEEDSFIDNTEAYDELIPQEVETVGGGFYINSGQLEFKTLSNFERPEDAERMPKPKKRLLSTSSESDSETEKAERRKKKSEMGSAATSGAESGKSGKSVKKRVNGHVGKKAKVGGDKSEGKLLAKKKKEDKEVKESGGKEIKVMKTITVKDMLRAKRDSMRKMEQEKKGRSSATVSSSEAEEDDDGDDDDDEEDGSDGSDSDSSDSGSDESDSDSASASEKEQSTKVNGGEEPAPKKVNSVKLPDNLPDHLLQDLNDLKDLADKSTGKFNFFESTVADLLLQIDVSSRMCGGSARNTIYKHLEEHLRVSRQTLMIKIKKIRIRKEDTKVKKALDKLEDAVTEVMPKIITNYEAERQKAIELRNSLPVGESGEKPEVKHPKKKFPWTDQLRTLLYDIANIRKQSFNILRPRKETEAEFIHSYLQKNVLPLWPSGWMKFEELQKELDRRKKNDGKAASKETKKTVHLSSGSPAVSSPTIASGTGGSLPSVVKSSGSKSEERKSIRPPQSSPVVPATGAASSPAQPPPSTSPASSKKTSDHSIINIISSPPSKTSSSQHSSQYQSHTSPQHPPRPQSRTPRPPSSFDEDLIQTHVINLEPAHSSSKTSPLPMDFRINSPALSSASSASSSRRPSSYQEQPPMAHSNSTPSNSNPNQRKDRKSLDDDSDSSIEIIGEYSVGEKRVDVLNLSLPSINKDKYKKPPTNVAGKAGSVSSSATASMRSSPMNINNNNSYDKPNKYGQKTTPSSSSASTPTTSAASNSAIKSSNASAGSFVLPSAIASLMQQDFAKMSGQGAASSSSSSRMSSVSATPGELDVLRIMKELHELQATQSSMGSKAGSSLGGQNRGNSPKPSHTFGPSKPKQDSPFASGSSQHYSQSPKTPTSSVASTQQQKQQQAHHNSTTKVIELDSFEDDFLFANYSYDSNRKRSYK
ncbi:yemanuclein isoform X2 [Aedes albopictus]|uniref:Yemanuclein n=1 Tax=Aedes albopictus TaxID=7160 RepID=A0ABM1XJN5_AEDAL